RRWCVRHLRVAWERPGLSLKVRMPKLCPSLGFVAHPLRYIHVMPKEQVRERLHNALHRGGKKATEEELEAVTEVVLLVVAEVVAELAIVIGDLETRVAAIESR